MEKRIIDLSKKAGPYLLVLLVGIVIGSLFLGKREHPSLPVQDTVVRAEWTCSMHPEVVRSEPGKCPLCGMDLVQSTTGRGVAGDSRFRMSPEAVALANVTTIAVSGGDESAATVTLSGIIKPNEKTNAIQTTLFDGRLEKLNVNFVGEYVAKGQQIGLIYSPELYSAQDQLITSASYKDTHEKLFNAARNALGLWKLTDAQIEQVIRTGKPIFNFPLLSDVSGTVTEILAKEGNYYNQGDALFKLSNLATVWAVFDVYENQISSLKRGQKIHVRANALGMQEWEGTIDFIEPVVNTTSRTVALRTTLPNRDGLLKPGMFIEAQVFVQGRENIISIPKSAVLWTGKRSVVYVKPFPEEPVFEMKEITLGKSFGDNYEVLEGLAAGDEIVVNGAFTLDAEAQLQRSRSMMEFSGPMSDETGEKNMQMTGNATAVKPLNDIIDAYIRLKNAFVGSDQDEVRHQAGLLAGILRTMPAETGIFAQNDHFILFGRYTDSIAASTDLTEQRRYFKPLSAQLESVAHGMKGLEQPVYVQFCPMADNNKGGTWLSLEKEIRNPYFGDKMLTCGSVRAILE